MRLVGSGGDAVTAGDATAVGDATSPSGAAPTSEMGATMDKIASDSALTTPKHAYKVTRKSSVRIRHATKMRTEKVVEEVSGITFGEPY